MSFHSLKPSSSNSISTNLQSGSNLQLHTLPSSLTAQYEEEGEQQHNKNRQHKMVRIHYHKQSHQEKNTTTTKRNRSKSSSSSSSSADTFDDLMVKQEHKE